MLPCIFVSCSSAQSIGVPPAAGRLINRIVLKMQGYIARIIPRKSVQCKQIASPVFRRAGRAEHREAKEHRHGACSHQTLRRQQLLLRRRGGPLPHPAGDQTGGCVKSPPPRTGKIPPCLLLGHPADIRHDPGLLGPVQGLLRGRHFHRRGLSPVFLRAGGCLRSGDILR